MSPNTSQIPDIKLPTLGNLNATVPADLDARRVASNWFSAFSAALESRDVQAVADLFLPESFWRDFLALTWDFRTFIGRDKIEHFLKDQLSIVGMRSVKLRDNYIELQRPYDDLAWVSTLFDFETGIGICSGIARLVPIQDGSWKAYVMFTNLEDLKGYPEKVGPLRNPLPNHGLWAKERTKEAEFLDTNPTVLIVGAGQSGLDLAVRLKAIGVSALIVDKNTRIGDNWRNRYEALCLHDPVCKSF